MRNKLIIFTVIIIGIIIAAVTVFNPSKAEDGPALYVTAEKESLQLRLQPQVNCQPKGRLKLWGQLMHVTLGLDKLLFKS